MIDPIHPDELVVAVLGKGIGESVIMHLGSGCWIIVDSFVDPASGEPAPLQFLRTVVDVDPIAAVESVVVSHLHRDHYAGISKLYEACGADTWLYFPRVPYMWHERFWSELRAAAQREESDPRFGTIEDASAAWDLASARQRLAGAGGPVGGIMCRGVATIRTISPRAHLSDRLDRAMREGTLPSITMIGPGANLTAIALWIKAGSISLLLGADMDCHQEVGWQAIAADVASDPPADVSLLKVPHHASHNPAFLESTAAWLETPLSLLTPYRGGASRLPNSDMIRLLRANSAAVYCTNLSPDRVQLARDFDDSPHVSTDALIARRPRDGSTRWTVTTIRNVFDDNTRMIEDERASSCRYAHDPV